eukprot:812067-Amphidinium_carterae.1
MIEKHTASQPPGTGMRGFSKLKQECRQLAMVQCQWRLMVRFKSDECPGVWNGHNWSLDACHSIILCHLPF